jgi:hypothetical protein
MDDTPRCPYVQPDLKYKTAKWYYQNVPEFREKAKQWSRDSQKRRKEQNPEAVREANRNVMRNKYQTDPEYREKQKERAKARYYAKKEGAKAQQEIPQSI